MNYNHNRQINSTETKWDLLRTLHRDLLPHSDLPIMAVSSEYFLEKKHNHPFKLNGCSLISRYNKTQVAVIVW